MNTKFTHGMPMRSAVAHPIRSIHHAVIIRKWFGAPLAMSDADTRMDAVMAVHHGMQSLFAIISRLVTLTPVPHRHMRKRAVHRTLAQNACLTERNANRHTKLYQ